MKLCIPVIFALLLVSTSAIAQNQSKKRVPLLREGTKVVEGVGTLGRESKQHPLVITIPRNESSVVDTFIVLPNMRLSEMEETLQENPNSTFSVSGDVLAYGNHNYLLIREALLLQNHKERIHPTSVPVDPSQESLREEDYEDSIADIVDDLESSTGSLVRSIRTAAHNPREHITFVDGSKVSSRRCHLVRNDSGAWIAVFVADSTGLSDPPCTLLPSTAFAELTKWMQSQNPSTPVLLSGELFQYYGHGYMVVHSWRAVHNTDHLD